jgi:hypothetical protein
VRPGNVPLTLEIESSSFVSSLWSAVDRQVLQEHNHLELLLRRRCCPEIMEDQDSAPPFRSSDLTFCIDVC